ncbi:MAG: hypothetical protein PHS73_00915 [Candidatus Peribacteraceae bacterium]|nr:hypothetical protein [Candidatus Peribacteraceae bacterium]
MHGITTPSPVTPASGPQHPERVTSLPHLGRDIEHWMWKVLNGGKVPSDRRAEDIGALQILAQRLRSIGGNGQADSILSEEILSDAERYARLLGWNIVRETA